MEKKKKDEVSKITPQLRSLTEVLTVYDKNVCQRINTVMKVNRIVIITIY